MTHVLPAATATEPVRCPHFGPCGGCTSLDIPYADELRAKEEKLKTAFSRHAELERAPFLPIIGAQEPLLYRNSIKVPFGWSKSGPVAGFFERRSHHIVDLETCLIQHPKLTEVLLATKAIVAELKIAIHDARTGRGMLRHLVARIGEGTGEMLAGIVVQAKGYGKIRGLADKLLERLGGAGLVGVVQNIHSDDEDHAILGDETIPLAGRAWINEVSDGLKLRTSLQTFMQVNSAQALLLYAEVMWMLADGTAMPGKEPLAEQRIVDLFCGVGPIALRAARAGAHVAGIEYSADAVKSARWAARANGLSERALFHAGDAAQQLEKLSEAGPIDAIVVDPPRRGLSDRLIKALLNSPARRLVYISCDPFTFARDLALLKPGFALGAVRGVDLFPRTLHLEAIALLRRT
ncbi:MAG: 23S rRNA (uracil(1939)-C(5))-methyltransferase RlmD [Myxococcales bacterium]|nr:23S rRNA (uracil(1939)-C(5))-methyltransferase RlmD [Myxococcales bacterium]